MGKEFLQLRDTFDSIWKLWATNGTELDKLCSFFSVYSSFGKLPGSILHREAGISADYGFIRQLPLPFPPSIHPVPSVLESVLNILSPALLIHISSASSLFFRSLRLSSTDSRIILGCSVPVGIPSAGYRLCKDRLVRVIPYWIT